MRVALASCQKLPEPDLDEALLLTALAQAGVEPQVLAWDDEAAPFHAHDLVVMRSTWNYFERVDDFVAWAERVAHTTRLLNPASIVRWNATKSYLLELEARGVDIVPTELVPRGTSRRIDEILAARGWDAIVVKPLVSAGSFRTERFASASAEAAQRFLDELVADRDAMVQRWMPSVETYGERSLVWIDGLITHAIRKAPRFAGGVEHVSGSEVPIADDERAFAERILEPLTKDLLYARIDMVREVSSFPRSGKVEATNRAGLEGQSPSNVVEGTLRLMELELIEPSLFLAQSPTALARFAAAIARSALPTTPR